MRFLPGVKRLNGLQNSLPLNAFSSASDRVGIPFAGGGGGGGGRGEPPDKGERIKNTVGPKGSRISRASSKEMVKGFPEEGKKSRRANRVGKVNRKRLRR